MAPPLRSRGSSWRRGWFASALRRDRCARAWFALAAQTVRVATARWIESAGPLQRRTRRPGQQRISMLPLSFLAFVYVSPSDIRSRLWLNAGLLEELDGARMIANACHRLGNAGRIVIIEWRERCRQFFLAFVQRFDGLVDDRLRHFGGRAQDHVERHHLRWRA